MTSSRIVRAAIGPFQEPCGKDQVVSRNDQSNAWHDQDRRADLILPVRSRHGFMKKPIDAPKSPPFDRPTCDRNGFIVIAAGICES
jgi:hypothetical protein